MQALGFTFIVQLIVYEVKTLVFFYGGCWFYEKSLRMFLREPVDRVFQNG